MHLESVFHYLPGWAVLVVLFVIGGIVANLLGRLFRAIVSTLAAILCGAVVGVALGWIHLGQPIDGLHTWLMTLVNSLPHVFR